jgi:GDP-4-dehydro-6-deoxy-D-mannose reductase
VTRSWPMRSAMSTRCAVVTGGTGFIGRHLVTALRRRGVNVRTLGRAVNAKDATHVVLDEASWGTRALDRVLEDAAPDCIFHLAGQARGTPAEITRANVDLMNSLLRALKSTGLRPRLVVAGSAAEYGSAIRDGEAICETAICAPLTAYGASKQAQTCAALAYSDLTGTSVIVARVFNPIGACMPTHLAIGDFANQIGSMPLEGGTLRVGNIEVRRDMIDVEHVATLLCQLADNPNARGIVNLCSGQAPLLRELVEMLIEGFGRKVEIEVDWARVRGNEPRTIIGSTDLLAKLGCPPPPTDFPAVIARICRSVEKSRALLS